jgi:catechol 2,3-dioxygenase-like lactoylglutathione lyase family enzyme
MPVRLQVVIDCADPAKLADFWAQVLGYQRQPPPAGFDDWESWARAQHVPEEQWNAYDALVDSAGPGPRMFFQRVPELKTVKNRVHLDVHPELDVAEGSERWPAVLAFVERLEALGARRGREYDEFGTRWIAVLDPEGNEFDVS